jgi:hypothetical protein
MQDGKIWDGYVALVDRGEVVVDYRPVAKVMVLVEDVPPRDGPLGLYWWVTKYFDLAAPLSAAAELPLAELPF